MLLTDALIEELKTAAGRIGDYGKITLVISGGAVDIVTEERVRLPKEPEKTAVRPPLLAKRK